VKSVVMGRCINMIYVGGKLNRVEKNSWKLPHGRGGNLQGMAASDNRKKGAEEHLEEYLGGKLWPRKTL